MATRILTIDEWLSSSFSLDSAGLDYYKSLLSLLQLLPKLLLINLLKVYSSFMPSCTHQIFIEQLLCVSYCSKINQRTNQNSCPHEAYPVFGGYI